MSFFKPTDFGTDNCPLCIKTAKIANAKLELELGNEYAIVTHFKAQNEILWQAIAAAKDGLGNCEGGDARVTERAIDEVLAKLNENHKP